MKSESIKQLEKMATEAELKPSRRRVFNVIDELKVVMYPELYRHTPGSGGLIHSINHGKDSKKKAVARVVISRSLDRLIKRGLLCVDANSNITVNGLSTIDKTLTNIAVNVLSTTDIALTNKSGTLSL